jgi:ABC-type Fe3+/spermidine/putrescine transport system ATPase subunit
MLSLKSISFSYPNQTFALNRISFDLKPRKILGVAGSSGSGKSTLLSAIFGLIDISEGEITFEKQKVTGPSNNLVPGNSQMRLAGQFHKLQDSLPVIEQIKYKLLQYKSDFREQKAIELLSLVGLVDKKSHTPKQLSGGQQQLVNLCCALAEEPKLLLLDEPFNNLDQSAKKDMKDYLISLREKTDMSILIVSHDPTDLLSISDEILVLKDGKKLQQGSPEKVFYEPKSEYVAGLFGEFNKIKVGSAMKFIRPSRIQISKKKFTGSAEVKIISSEFHGSFYQYHVLHQTKGEITVSSSEKITGNKSYIKF